MYNYKYKLINFRPSNTLETTFTIGAVVENGVKTTLVLNETLPPESYIGHNAFIVLKGLLDSIKGFDWISVNQRPDTFGNRIVYSILRDVPIGVVDSVKWVKNIFEVEGNE